MAQRGSGYKRRKNDKYYTPAWAVGALVSAYPVIRELPCWEPCAGAGHICAALERLGIPQIFASDIAPARKRAWDGSIARTNAFKASRPSVGGRLALVSNTPYGASGRIAADMLRHFVAALMPHGDIVAALLPMGFDCGSTRYDLFGRQRHCAAKVVLTDRLRWVNVRQKPNGPSNDHCWWIWDGTVRRRQGPPSHWRSQASGEAALAGAS